MGDSLSEKSAAINDILKVQVDFDRLTSALNNLKTGIRQQKSENKELARQIKELKAD